MSDFTRFDTEDDTGEYPPLALPAWNPSLPVPPELRSHRLVLASASPLFLMDRYVWRAGGLDWLGVDPPNAVIPAELFNCIVLLTRFTYFETRPGAMAALEMAILHLERTGE